MLQAFRCEKKVQGDGIFHFTISGDLDEKAKLPTKQEFDGAKTLVFDFMGLRYISSAGIKAWIFLMEDVLKLGPVQIHFIHCSKTVIDCVNSIEGFCPDRAQVLSFKIPYFCELCDKSFSILETSEKMRPRVDELLTENPKLEPRHCPECHKEAELDLVPEHFFRFLRKPS